MNGIKQINFQKKCCDWLYDTCSKEDTKQLLMLKSPTGSGKTIILLSFIEKYLQDYPNTAFVWLCPGKEIGRRFLGFELDKNYYKVSIDRLNGIDKNGQMSIFTDFENV